METYRLIAGELLILLLLGAIGCLIIEEIPFVPSRGYLSTAQSQEIYQ